MNDAAQDEIGVRVASGGGNLWYTNGQTTRLFGAGIMDKPISNFRTHPTQGQWFDPDAVESPFFGGINISVHNRVIPEPAEYALVFGLLALAFVIVRRRFVLKKAK